MRSAVFEPVFHLRYQAWIPVLAVIARINRPKALSAFTSVDKEVMIAGLNGAGCGMSSIAHQRVGVSRQILQRRQSLFPQGISQKSTGTIADLPGPVIERRQSELIRIIAYAGIACGMIDKRSASFTMTKSAIGFTQIGNHSETKGSKSGPNCFDRQRAFLVQSSDRVGNPFALVQPLTPTRLSIDHLTN